MENKNNTENGKMSKEKWATLMAIDIIALIPFVIMLLVSLFQKTISNGDIASMTFQGAFVYLLIVGSCIADKLLFWKTSMPAAFAYGGVAMAFGMANVNATLGWILFVVVLLLGVLVKKFQTKPISGVLAAYWIMVIYGMVHDTEIHKTFDKMERTFTAQKGIEYGLHHYIILLIVGVITYFITMEKSYTWRSPIKFHSKTVVKATETPQNQQKTMQTKQEPKVQPKKEESKQQPKKEEPKVEIKSPPTRSEVKKDKNKKFFQIDYYKKMIGKKFANSYSKKREELRKKI